MDSFPNQSIFSSNQDSELYDSGFVGNSQNNLEIQPISIFLNLSTINHQMRDIQSQIRQLKPQSSNPDFSFPISLITKRKNTSKNRIDNYVFKRTNCLLKDCCRFKKYKTQIKKDKDYSKSYFVLQLVRLQKAGRLKDIGDDIKKEQKEEQE